MKREWRAAVWRFLVPGAALVLAAAVISARPSALPAAFHPLAAAAPAVSLTVGLLLSAYFHRSRLVFALLLIALGYAGVTHPWLSQSAGRAAATRSFPLIGFVSVLVPANLILLALVKERGVLTRKGVWLLGVIVVQAIVAVVAVRQGLRLDARLILPDWAHRATIPQPGLVAWLLAGLVFLVRFMIAREAVDGAFFWTAVSVFLALEQAPGLPAGWYWTAAAAALSLAVLQSSYVMAYHDELTGLPGRRAFNRMLLQLGDRYTIAMVDVDHFKTFNDVYGHDVGDQVLRMVAARLAGVEGGGRAFRYGGEEFAVVFDGLPAGQALPFLETLRRTIEEATFTLRRRWRPPKRLRRPRTRRRPSRVVSVTVSIGAAEADARGVCPEQVVKAADQALYRAKQAGRNMVKT
ncbi:diguanylate cyclase [Candidatus Nitrospira bockiana]